MTNEAPFRRCALEAVLAAAAGRPPITKLRPLSRTPALGGLKRSFVSVPAQKVVGENVCAARREFLQQATGCFALALVAAGLPRELLALPIGSVEGRTVGNE